MGDYATTSLRDMSVRGPQSRFSYFYYQINQNISEDLNSRSPTVVMAAPTRAAALAVHLLLMMSIASLARGQKLKSERCGPRDAEQRRQRGRSWLPASSSSHATQSTIRPCAGALDVMQADKGQFSVWLTVIGRASPEIQSALASPATNSAIFACADADLAVILGPYLPGGPGLQANSSFNPSALVSAALGLVAVLPAQNATTFLRAHAFPGSLSSVRWSNRRSK